MRLFKNEWLTKWPRDGYKNIVHRITKWGISALYAMYDPGLCTHMLNKAAMRAYGRYDAKLEGGIWVGVWRRGEAQIITVARDYNPEDAVKILKRGIKSLDGSALHVRGVL